MGGDQRPRRFRVLMQMARERYEQIFAAESRERLHALAEVIGPFGAGEVHRLSPRLAEADALFVQGSAGLDPPLGAATLEGAPRLRWIADTSGGPPQLDYRVAFARGIAVTDCRRAFHRSVAEMALGLYLAVSRDIVVHDRALHTPDAVEGAPKPGNRDASRRTLGFVGFGGIAQALVPFLAPFEPRLLAYDPYVPAAAMAAAGVEAAGLPDVLRRAYAVFVLAMPTPENHGLLGPAELDLLGPEQILLVVSRAALVDEAALIERLRAGRFRAAMDVFATEPLPAHHPYRSLPNVVLTPHRAGGTADAYRRIGEALVADLERLVAGQAPVHNASADKGLLGRLGRLEGA